MSEKVFHFSVSRPLQKAIKEMPECFALMTFEFCSHEREENFLLLTDNDFGKVVKNEIKSSRKRETFIDFVLLRACFREVKLLWL